MDTIKIVEKLAELARKEKPPQFDVSKAVITEIYALQRAPISFASLEWFAGISAAAASIVMLLSFNAWKYAAEPFIQILMPLQEISLW